MKLHFISGLPRSGLTLLAAILRQPPCPPRRHATADARHLRDTDGGARPDAVRDHATCEFSLPGFAHDFENVSFDRRLGAAGLHRVGRRAARAQHKDDPVAGLFARFSGDAFWRERANPRGVTVV